jgi:hypothetical protein
MSNDWDWRQRKLAGEPMEMNPDSPHAGFYRPWSRTTFGARLAGFCAMLIRVRNWHDAAVRKCPLCAAYGGGGHRSASGGWPIAELPFVPFGRP